jgi:hypothetical protein
MTLASLPLEQIAQRCAEETQKFRQRQPHDTQFCFELFRRALAEGVNEAFTWAYNIYEREVRNWVHQHRGFEHTGESADLFVNAGFSQFYFALRGPGFAKCPALPQLLAYLKACVHSAIAQYLRDHGGGPYPPFLDPDEEGPPAPSDPGAGLVAGEIWRRIRELLPDESDQLLARCRFGEGLKPGEIVAYHAARWRSEREVSVALYRIRQKLRRDPALRELLGLEAAPPDDPAL